MGKKGSRPKGAREYIKTPIHHDGYSVSSEFTPEGSPCRCDDCFDRRRQRKGVDYCCSRETCSPNRRPSPPSGSYLNKKSLTKEVEELSRNSGRRREGRQMKKSGMEVIVVNDRHLNVRKTPSSCSSCSSCDSCHSDNSSYTRIELRNNLFTSPLQSTEASFYHSPYAPSSEIYSQKENRRRNKELKGRPPRMQSIDGQSRSPRRKGIGTYADDYRRGHEDSSYKNSQVKAPKRASSFNGGPSFLEEWNQNGKEREVRGGGRRIYHSDSPERRLRRMSKNRESQQGSSSRSPSHTPPSRISTKTNDSGVGRSYHTTGSSGKSAVGSNSDEEKENKIRKKKMVEERKKIKDIESATTKNSEQTELLNKMVNQTREHRKQIKTLENELERLRITGDALSTCEVNQRDVEWRPGDVVGEGSFSTVYKGTYCGTEVAVKELKCKLSQDDKNYFRSEAALLQQLHHPRVVLLMGVCTTAARPFMLLEYLSGGTLHTMIHTTTRERLDHAAYFVVAKDIAQGINYLHRHEPQVLHLDLKSMNVLLDNYTRAKIADFGFSILRRTRGGSAVERGTIRGTPAWMAPELLTKGEVSVKCDVYSYAVILWEMLTAAHPFQGLDIYHIMEAVEAGVRPPLPNSGVSAELRELITSCWAQNPSLRPSFEEVLGALETASLPSSWRKVLHRASIEPSALADVTTARAIIGMIERSVDLLERSNGRKQGKSDVKPLDLERRRDPKRTPKDAHRRSESSSNGKRIMEPSPSKGYRRSQSRGVDALYVEKDRKVSRSSSPTKKERSSDYRRDTPISKDSKGRVNDIKDEVTNQRRSRSPSKGIKTKDHKVSREGSKLSTRPSRYKVEYVAEESHLSSSNESGSSSRPSSDDDRLKYSEDTGLSDQDFNRSRIMSPSRRRESSKQRLRSKSPVKSRQARNRSISPPSRSPERSPQRRQRSPFRRRSDNAGVERKQDSGPHNRYTGLMLTAEQLMSQKQRLRPVRPSTLRDLSLLPQSSLNDISYILKQAMSHRRDALEQLHSGRDTVHSKDLQEWSDWF